MGYYLTKMNIPNLFLGIVQISLPVMISLIDIELLECTFIVTEEPVNIVHVANAHWKQN